MKEKYFKTAITVAILLIVGIYNNLTEYLTGEDYPAPLMMIFYGIVSLVLNCIVGPLTKNAIFPKQWKFQLFRMVNNGISNHDNPIFAISFELAVLFTRPMP